MRLIFLTLIIANFGYYIYQEYLREPMPNSPNVGSSQTAESIVLLSEDSVNNLRDREMGFVVNNPLQAKDGGVTCLAVGPFRDLFVGQNVVERLNAINLAVELKAVDTPTGENDYRVMLPAATSVQDATRKLQELKSQDIVSHVLTRGKDALSISLGVFSTQDAALASQAALLNAGYDVVVAAVTRMSREFWIYSKAGKDIDLDNEAWSAITGSYPELERRSQPCTGGTPSE